MRSTLDRIVRHHQFAEERFEQRDDGGGGEVPEVELPASATYPRTATAPDTDLLLSLLDEVANHSRLSLLRCDNDGDIEVSSPASDNLTLHHD